MEAPLNRPEGRTTVEPPDTDLDRSAARWLRLALIAVVVAVTLLNGSEFFLKRIGILDRAAYERYVQMHREGAPYVRGFPSEEQLLREEPYLVHLLPRGGPTAALKIPKDLVVVALFGLLAVCAWWKGSFPSFRAAWPGYVLLAWVALTFLLTSLRFGLLLPLAGLRAFSFLPLALLLAACGRFRGAMASAMTTSVIVLLGFETVIAGVEAVRGLPMWGYLSVSPDLAARLSGTFVMPNTMGCWAVISFAFYLSSEPGRARWIAASLALALVVASNSGTGAVVFAILAAVAVVRAGGPRWLVPGAVMVAVILLFLPPLIGRKDVFLSLPERVVEVERIVDELEGPELLAGRALGAGSGAAFHLLDRAGPWESIARKRAADSLPAMLLMGTGVIGLFAFYGMLARAALRNPRFMPFWIAFCLATLTVKVVEVFPISLLLASALACDFLPDESRERPG